MLWYFQDAAQQLKTSIDAINALIRNVVLQERGGINVYEHGELALRQQMDNEFDLLFVVVYQKILQLSYVDKFLSDVQREFRERYRDQLQAGLYYQNFDFSLEYGEILQRAEEESRMAKTTVRQPRRFEDSKKSMKTVSSMVEKPGRDKPGKKNKKDEKNQRIEEIAPAKLDSEEDEDDEEVEVEVEEEEEEEEAQEELVQKETSGQNLQTLDCVPGLALDPEEVVVSEEELRLRRERLMSKRTPKAGKGNKAKSPKQPKKGKEATTWDLDGKDSKSLDFSKKSSGNGAISSLRPDFLPASSEVGRFSGELKGMDIPSEKAQKTSGGGMFSMFRSLVGGKTLTEADMAPVIEKLRDHLISKNVASEIAVKLCDSVSTRLEGKVVGTFEGVQSSVRTTLTEALVQLLTPKRRLDILRDVVEAKSNHRPYSIAFCGVNGVGKSTNLAKITFWLIENKFRVLIAACDTFRAGAVEQLRTHKNHLNSLHPPENNSGKSYVELFEQGYGKDAADIAKHAIDYSRKNGFDVVLIDTAGRMQDNEPLMRALSKLIIVNEPDLCLFVGEALVGNEAVDQLVKFNRALANHSTSQKPQMIDGIVLTKFDTIDDKVGAAISMTYITGQPIVFVGCGQTYTDLRKLDAKAVVHSLMK